MPRPDAQTRGPETGGHFSSTSPAPPLRRSQDLNKDLNKDRTLDRTLGRLLDGFRDESSHSEDTELFPLCMAEIAAQQMDDEELTQRMSKESKRVYTKRAVNDNDVILEDGKVFIPKPLRHRIMDWYHHWLCHPGANRMHKTMNITMTWPNQKSDIEYWVKTCKRCQLAKKKTKKYGKLPAKKTEVIPWHNIQIDCIGPYTVQQKVQGKLIKLKMRALTIIDPVTNWFEICSIPEDDMSSDKISTLFYDAWLCRYPRPVRITYDNGSEFKKHFKSLCREYDLNQKPTTVKNPQANRIVERVHQTVNNMIRCFDLNNLDLDPNDPFGDILARIGWAVRSTYHTTLEATPGQLVFGRDMLFDIDFTADWHNMYISKQKMINKNNSRENAKRIDYTYQIGDKVTLKADYLKTTQKAQLSNIGPYTIIETYDNGCVRVQRGQVQETLNIRRLDPFFNRTSSLE